MNAITRPRSSCALFMLAAAATVASGAWQWINLHPAGASESGAYGVDSAQETGYAVVNGQTVASVWSGSAGSWVNLNPSGAAGSESWGMNGGTQAGRALVTKSIWHAGLWTGSAGTWMDLNPSGATQSGIYGSSSGRQVGYAVLGGTQSAGLWFGTAGSWVNLHPAAATSSGASGTDGARQVGYVILPSGPQPVAALWKGSAASWVNLGVFPGYYSTARDVSGAQQVGYIAVPPTAGSHASKWSGTAASWIDLHPTTGGPGSSSTAFCVSNGYQAGSFAPGGSITAALWQGTAASYFKLHNVLPAYFQHSEVRDIYVKKTTFSVTIRAVGRAFNSQTNRWEAVLWYNVTGANRIHTIEQTEHRFVPDVVHVRAGDTIQWKWSDGEHTVTSGNNCEFDHLYLDEPLDREFSTAEFTVPRGVSEIPYFSRSSCDQQMTGLIIVAPAASAGDMNCDQRVDFGDINPFILALGNPDEYQRQYPDCDVNNADCNNDGAIDFGDINAFVALLSGE